MFFRFSLVAAFVVAAAVAVALLHKFYVFIHWKRSANDYTTTTIIDTHCIFADTLQVVPVQATV